MRKNKRSLLLASAIIIHLFSIAQNVGIGNNNPQQKLHVTGGILSDSIRIGTGPSMLRTVVTGPIMMAVNQDVWNAYSDAIAPGWQSFTASSNSVLEYVSLGHVNIVVIGELRIYAGEGTSGTMLLSVPMSAATTGFNNSPPLNVNLQAGQKYTIWVANKANWTFQLSNVYAGGVSDQGLNYDYRFRVYTKDVSTVFNAMGNGAVQMSMDQSNSVLTVNGRINTGALQISGGAGAGKVLVSDAVGNAGWQTPVSDYWGLDGNSTAVDLRLGTTTGHPLRIITNNNEVARFHTNGALSIGTAFPPDPNDRLYVLGETRLGGGLNVGAGILAWGNIQSVYDVIVGSNLYVNGQIQQENLVSPSMHNVWLATPGYAAPGYYKGKDGRVYLQGTVSNGLGGAIFTLQAGYRPAATMRFLVPSNDADGQVVITIDGSGIVASGSSGFITVHLDGISFRVN